MGGVQKGVLKEICVLPTLGEFLSAIPKERSQWLVGSANRSLGPWPWSCTSIRHRIQSAICWPGRRPTPIETPLPRHRDGAIWEWDGEMGGGRDLILGRPCTQH